MHYCSHKKTSMRHFYYVAFNFFFENAIISNILFYFILFLHHLWELCSLQFANLIFIEFLPLHDLQIWFYSWIFYILYFALVYFHFHCTLSFNKAKGGKTWTNKCLIKNEYGICCCYGCLKKINASIYKQEYIFHSLYIIKQKWCAR